MERPLKSDVSAAASDSKSVEHSLVIKAVLDDIETALGWLRQLAKLHQWSERTSFGLVLSADEALTNIVTHSQKATHVSGAVVRLVCAPSNLEVALRIEDEGLPFDPTQSVLHPAADSVEDAVIGGHGLRLMRHYLKAVHYSREDDRNVLTLIASLDTAGST